MVQELLVGLVAGLAAGLLFVAPFGGTPLAIPLFALTGLPIAIAGLGWGSSAALLAAIAGTALTFALAEWDGAAVFVLLFAIPVAWAITAAVRPRVGGDIGRWRSPGLILAHAAVAVALGVIGIGILVGFDPPTLTQDITNALVEWAATTSTGTGAPPTAADIEPLVRLNVALMPATIAIIGLAMVVLDIYLAARSVRFSDRLKRPEQNLSTIALPIGIPAAFAAATALAFAPGAVGHASEAVAGALGAAVALVGLAVIHALTRGMNGRIAILIAVYAVVLLSGVPIILLALIGVAESVFHLRARGVKPRGPRPT